MDDLDIVPQALSDNAYDFTHFRNIVDDKQTFFRHVAFSLGECFMSVPGLPSWPVWP
tara:strand:- start:227 stop:397 length:171 start_codon:yes stop_codon:yes gene_type:complete